MVDKTVWRKTSWPVLIAVLVKAVALGIPAGTALAVLIKTALCPTHNAVLGLLLTVPVNAALVRLLGRAASPCRCPHKATVPLCCLCPGLAVPDKATALDAPADAALTVLVETDSAQAAAPFLWTEVEQFQKISLTS